MNILQFDRTKYVNYEEVLLFWKSQLDGLTYCALVTGVIWCHETWSRLVHVMACRLYGAKSLVLRPMSNSQLHLCIMISNEIWIKIQYFSLIKKINLKMQSTMSVIFPGFNALICYYTRAIVVLPQYWLYHTNSRVLLLVVVVVVMGGWVASMTIVMLWYQWFIMLRRKMDVHDVDEDNGIMLCMM